MMKEKTRYHGVFGILEIVSNETCRALHDAWKGPSLIDIFSFNPWPAAFVCVRLRSKKLVSSKAATGPKRKII